MVKVDNDSLTSFDDIIHDKGFAMKRIIEDIKSDSSTTKNRMQSGMLQIEAELGSDYLEALKLS